jgi:autotransporter passenger strand-loop-strand repeat protein
MTLGNGALGDVLPGGTAITTLVSSGAIEIVAAGGIASATTISGGKLEVATGGSTGSGAVTFATSGGGILQLDDSQHFGGLVAGFGQPDFLDLRDIAFGSSTSVSYTSDNPGNTSGTLTVTDGAHTANITLIGQYVVGQFTSASDGHGGTLIGDPPVSAMTDAQAHALITTQHSWGEATLR